MAPFFGPFTVPLAPSSPLTSAQMVIVDPAQTDGLRLSQAVESRFNPCNYAQDFDAAVVGDPGSYPPMWVDGGGNVPWRVNQGSTYSAGTGPSVDHTTGSGNYLYCETSNTGFPNKSFVILAPPTSTVGLSAPACSFWYHMDGATVGTLELQQLSGGTTWSTLWSLSGSQGPSWLEAVVPLSSTGGMVQLRFRYVSGTNFTGDVAIDDFWICG